MENQQMYRHLLQMAAGVKQGLTTSNLLYASAKWTVQRKTQNMMIQRFPDFQINFQSDWVDDGVQVMKDKYVKD